MVLVANPYSRPMSQNAFIVAIARTRIAPRGGLHRDKTLDELATPVLTHLTDAARNAGMGQSPIDRVILGNAMAAGGNPARLCALAVLGEEVPALTVDTQCCSGMDAIATAAALIAAGRDQIIIAGGVESFSQAPQRLRRTDHGYEPYTQARFAPSAQQDPPVLGAAQDFAERFRIPRAAQEAYAIRSHQRTLAHYPDPATRDPFARELRQAFCQRLPPLIRDNHYSLTALTVAPEADAAAAVLVVSGKLAKRFPWAIEIVDAHQAGCAPETPAIGGLLAAHQLLSEHSRRTRDRISVVELMESFAAQAIQNQTVLGFPQEIVNARGGLLAAGHAIGASGAVLIGNVVLRLLHQPSGDYGLALIPAAGGLGSAMLCRKP
ncbi:MAG: thiolase family protein [Burkholderiaceae bacterium]|nr:thiolase family protein [Burkholderiaceae bacterium]